MRKAFLVLLGGVAGAALTVLALQTPLTALGVSASAASADAYRQVNLFGDIFERVRTNYVDKPDDTKLIETAINGMVSGLDPHSSYMGHRDMQVQTRRVGGLGIEVTQEDGYIKVVAPIDDTPAARAGILAGDLITHLDGESIKGLNLAQAVDKMRGPVNSKITLRITRKGADKPIDVTLMRDVGWVRSVVSRTEGDIGYIRTSSFNEQTTDGLKKAIADISAQDSRRQAQGLHRPCATIRAACSTRRSRSATRSSSTARSSPRAAAMTRKPSASTPTRAISSTASRSSC